MFCMGFLFKDKTTSKVDPQFCVGGNGGHHFAIYFQIHTNQEIGTNCLKITKSGHSNVAYIPVFAMWWCPC